MAWPHLHLLLSQLSSILRQPLAIPLYLAYLLFGAGVGAWVGALGARTVKFANVRQPSAEERRNMLPSLNRVAIRRGVTLVAVIAGTGIGIGVLGLSYTNEWSLDNVAVGLVLIGIALALFLPLAGMNYVVWRRYLLKYGHFIPSE